MSLTLFCSLANSLIKLLEYDLTSFNGIYFSLVDLIMLFFVNFTPHKLFANCKISSSELLLLPKVALVRINCVSFVDEILALNLLNRIDVSIPVAPA
ncbi:unknown [Firmicutes bacterium CAG:449]|nr:unknown [Firmicutes bacterium CAG:449]